MNRMIENILHKLLYTCEEATYLLEIKASNQSLSALQRIRLKGHLAMCKWCTAYEKKVNIIDQAMMRLSENSKDNLLESELMDFKNVLKESLR